MKKKTKKKKNVLFSLLRTVIMAVLGFLIVPVLLDKGTDIAWHILYPDKED